ncbi:hypothetical protein [Amycolatopsis palatopharyngis]|uniref:hypothetical protein n=1 Tax=Amycolatopsis palatopharyngis TaxID=187982 RepID=UPI000E25273F|nr:hypothetical protein [Amycolatopsis palatopharyngis]
MIRTLVLSRGIHRALVVAILAAGVSAVIGRNVIDVDLSPVHPNRLPVAELCAIVAATLMAILTRPRFWEWDRTSRGRRAHVLAGVVAALEIMLPALCVLVVVPGLPERTPWVWVLANALTMAALVQALAPLTGPLWAGLLGLLSWLGFGLIHNLEPGLRHVVPTAAYPEADAHWGATVAIIAIALLVHVRTCGATALSRRRSAD